MMLFWPWISMAMLKRYQLIENTCKSWFSNGRFLMPTIGWKWFIDDLRNLMLCLRREFTHELWKYWN